MDKLDAETKSDDKFVGDHDQERAPKQASSVDDWLIELRKDVFASKAGESGRNMQVLLLRNAAGVGKMIIDKTKLCKKRNWYKATSAISTMAILTQNAACDGAQLIRSSCFSRVCHKGRNFGFCRDGFLQFYDDDTHEHWTLKFNRQPDEEEFVKKLLDLGFKIAPDPNNNYSDIEEWNKSSHIKKSNKSSDIEKSKNSSDTKESDTLSAKPKTQLQNIEMSLKVNELEAKLEQVLNRIDKLEEKLLTLDKENRCLNQNKEDCQALEISENHFQCDYEAAEGFCFV